MKHIDIAKQYIGQKEVAGVNSNPWLKQLWLDLKVNWLWTMYASDDSKLPWCGGFIAKVMKEAGYSFPSKFWSAKEWSAWGKECNKPFLGAVAVMTRDGGGHVTIVTGVTKDGKNFRGLGGNQNDQVCEAWFPTARVTTWRLPDGVVEMLPPVAKLGTLSKSEA